jgi:AcrR family transcriptional regulator
MTMSVAQWEPLTPRTTVDVSEETLHRILDAAGRLFARFGLRRTTVVHVADEAGMSKATIYRYVSSKADLVNLYATREWRLFVEDFLRRRWRSDLDADEVARVVAEMVVTARAHPVMAKLLEDERDVVGNILVSHETQAGMAAVVDVMSPLFEAAGYPEPARVVEWLLRMFVSLIVIPPATHADDADMLVPLFQLPLTLRPAESRSWQR